MPRVDHTRYVRMTVTTNALYALVKLLEFEQLGPPPWKHLHGPGVTKRDHVLDEFGYDLWELEKLVMDAKKLLKRAAGFASGGQRGAEVKPPPRHEHHRERAILKRDHASSAGGYPCEACGKRARSKLKTCQGCDWKVCTDCIGERKKAHGGPLCKTCAEARREAI